MDPSYVALKSRIKRDFSTFSPRIRLMLLASLLSVLPLTLTHHGVVERVEPTLLRWWFAARGAQEASQSVSLVRLDKLAYNHVGQSTGVMFPRVHLADVIDGIAAAGAKLIVLDLIFEREWADREGDKRLAEALRRSPSVIGRHIQELVDVDAFGKKSLRRLPVNPIPLFSDAASKVMSLHLPIDLGRVQYITLSGERGFRTDAEIPLLGPLGELIPARHRAPGPFDFINYYGGPNSISSISAAELLTPGREIDPRYFKDRVVFIGLVADAGVGIAGGKDTFITSYSNAPMPGVEIHATIAGNLLDGNWIRRFDTKHEAVAMALWLFFTAMLMLLAGPIAALGVMILSAAIWLGVSFYLFCKFYYFIPGLSLTLLCLPVLPVAWWLCLSIRYLRAQRRWK